MSVSEEEEEEEVSLRLSWQQLAALVLFSAFINLLSILICDWNLFVSTFHFFDFNPVFLSVILYFFWESLAVCDEAASPGLRSACRGCLKGNGGHFLPVVVFFFLRCRGDKVRGNKLHRALLLTTLSSCETDIRPIRSSIIWSKDATAEK